MPDTGTLEDMWAAVSKALDIPQERMALSKDPKLVSSRRERGAELRNPCSSCCLLHTAQDCPTHPQAGVHLWKTRTAGIGQHHKYEPGASCLMLAHHMAH